MSGECKTTHITPVGGNVFADLGFAPEEAARLLAETDQAIAEKLSIKDSLMAALADWIAANKLGEAAAARILGVSRARVSAVLNKKVGEFTVDALVAMQVRAGKWQVRDD